MLSFWILLEMSVAPPELAPEAAISGVTPASAE